jgi:hypothetical protein
MSREFRGSGVPTPLCTMDLVTIGAVEEIPDVSGIDTGRVRYSPTVT